MSTVTVVPTVELDNVPPRVRLDVTDTGTPAVFSTAITRLDPDGRTVPVRTPDGNPLVLSTSGSDRVGIVYDYEAPFDAAVQYSSTTSPSVLSTPITVEEPRVWLIHPGIPVLSTPIMVQQFGARSRPVAQGVFQPMGRRSPVVQTDGRRKAEEYELTVLTRSEAEREALSTVLDDASSLLLNVPASKGFGVGAEYVTVGTVTENRLARFAGSRLRSWSLPCVVVDRPVGGSQVARTYAQVLADYGSYADVLAAYDTYFDLLAGP